MKKMSSTLTKKDYISILNFYKLPIPKTRYLLKKKAETILGQKLCKCIKKVGEEPRSIGICSKAVFNQKGLSRGKFTCKKKQKVAIRKMTSTKKRSKSWMKTTRKMQRGGVDVEEGVVTKVPRITTFEMLDKYPYGKEETIVQQMPLPTQSNVVDIETGFKNDKEFSGLSGTDYGEFVDPFEGGRRRKTRKLN